MVIASSKNSEMTFIYLPEQHPRTLYSLPDGRFYERYNFNIVQVPHGCVPVWCSYSGDWVDHSWTNPMSGLAHETNPLGLTTNDTSFYEGFYEMTAIDGITFREGEAWCPDTSAKIHLDKIDPKSIWNPFFQRYDPPCNGDPSVCDPTKINYDCWDMVHQFFTGGDMATFTNIYCECCICKFCGNIHTDLGCSKRS